MTQPPPVIARLPLYGEPISLDQAKAVMEAAEAEAAREGWPMVIAIVDSGANLVMLHRMDQAQLGSILVAQQKAETAVQLPPTDHAPSRTSLAEGGVGASHSRNDQRHPRRGRAAPDLGRAASSERSAFRACTRRRMRRWRGPDSWCSSNRALPIRPDLSIRAHGDVAERLKALVC